MLFNSFEFIGLVLATTLLYYFPWLRRIQVGLLITASFVFYAFGQPYLLILLVGSILINAITSFKVIHATEASIRRAWAVAGVSTNLAVLFLFKYGGLIGQSLSWGGDAPNSLSAWLVALPLPIGISFYTFQGISLVCDIWRLPDGARWRGHDPAKAGWSTHLLHTTFFLSFFPQLVAGPIVKAQQFLPQIKPKFWRDVPWDKVVETLIMGYFLKMVIADNLRDQTFWMTFPFFHAHSTATLVTLLFGYSIQIFADFAGYSLIAIGVGQLFGYRLPSNFNFPYRAISIADFWHRWHISLSSWLREYLYIPLGGNRRGQLRTYLNLMIVMGLGGLWHGAAWSYLAWGLYHGLGLGVERMFTRREPPTYHPYLILLKILGVFAFVSLGWLLFRLNNFAEVLAYLSACRDNTAISIDTTIVSYVVLYSLPVIGWHAVDWWRNSTGRTQPVWLRSFSLGACLFAILTNAGTPEAFIYFQF